MPHRNNGIGQQRLRPRRSTGVSGLFLALSLAVFPASARDAEPERSLLFCVRLHNTTEDPLEHVALRVPVPVTNEYQTVFSTTITPRPQGFLDVAASGRFAFFDIPTLAPGAAFTAVAHIRCRLREHRPHKRHLNTQLAPELRERCLGASHRVDPAHPAIAAVASALRDHATSDHELARSINQFLAAECQYELDDRQEDAVQTLEAKRGSCSELSRLYVALARNCGIPARFVGGSRLRCSLNGYIDAVHHRWVEVFLDQYGWFPLDISLNVSGSKPEKRFGLTPATHLALVRNAGVAGHALYSAGLTLANHSDALERTVRTFWFSERPDRLRTAMRLLADVDDSLRSRQRMWDYVMDLEGPLAVPFLDMLLYAPLALQTQDVVIRALAQTGARAAVVPLLDYGLREPRLSRDVEQALSVLVPGKTGTIEEWRAWLRSKGLDYLRGR